VYIEPSIQRVNVYVPTVVDVHDAWAAIGAAAIIKAAIDGLIMIFSLRFWKPKLGIVHASPVLALSDHEFRSTPREKTQT
jgi:hypothetical protein